MRIIIETEPAAAQPRVSYESAPQPAQEQFAGPTVEKDAPAEALDGGTPAEELLTALGAPGSELQQPVQDAPRDNARRVGSDAGGAPSWLVGVIEGGESRRRMQ